ncbi:MAG: alpha-hydroxy-acid oxidizing protein [Vicinamibacterales bacterium]
MSEITISRRVALERAGALIAAGVVPADAASGQSPGASSGARWPEARLAPLAELVNVVEYEAECRKQLGETAHAQIAGGDRTPFDRITLRPRVLTPAHQMDLSQTIFGETHFAPLIAGPMANQRRFHPEAEVATARGCKAARALMVVSSRSSIALSAIAAEAGAFWYQVFADDPPGRAPIAEAVQLGAKATVVTVGADADQGRAAPRPGPLREAAIASVVRASAVPVIVKGVRTVAEAARALELGAQGIVVSGYRGQSGDDPPLILDLPEIADAVAGRVPVFVDGSVRRGTDVLVALALGATAVWLGRPVMWGLAAYGADGVQGVLQKLQTDLGRYMGMCGKSTLGALDRTVVRVHGPRPTTSRPA